MRTRIKTNIFSFIFGYKKAFDSVSQNILLYKLHHYRYSQSKVTYREDRNILWNRW